MSVIIFLVILVVLIVGHELGHFLVAKRAGMRVPEFGIGFPPKVWGIGVGDTEYTINALPFGGFVKIVGEDADADDPNAFSKKSKWAQAAVLVAGPGMNVVLGCIAFWIAFMVGVPTALSDDSTHIVRDQRVVVSEVLADGPAAAGGVKQGDTLVAVTVSDVRVPIASPETLFKTLNNVSQPVELELIRADEPLTLTLTPKQGVIPDEPGRYAVGIGSLAIGIAAYGPFEALWRSLEATGTGLVAIVTGIGTLIASAFTLSADITDISGPVGIAGLVGDASAFGAGQVLILAALISLNLAVLNLLPFPALDGGRLALLGIEAVRGRALSQTFVGVVNTAGFVLLITLMLVVTWNDIAKLLA
jgi:regulator of sigma E protease